MQLIKVQKNFLKIILVFLSIPIIHSIIPYKLISKLYRKLINLNNKKFLSRTNSEIFSKIYSEGMWGQQENDAYYSGSGTTTNNVKQYINFINSFIKDHHITSIIDVGCGDFKIGNELTKENPNVKYQGVDVVPSLIEYNIKTFSNENIKFSCIDASNELLPDADMCLIRQVLQHLSNIQIIAILDKLSKFKFVLITEHLPIEKFLLEINKDKTPGHDIRLFDGSGVFIQHPPFNIKCTEVLSYREDMGIIKVQFKIFRFIKAEIKTFLVEN